MRARLSGYQGYHAFPHTVMGLGVKAPVMVDAAAKLEKVAAAYKTWLEEAAARLPLAEKLRRRASMIYRSKGERHQLAGYYDANFTIDLDAPVPQPAYGRLPALRAAAAR